MKRFALFMIPLLALVVGVGFRALSEETQNVGLTLQKLEGTWKEVRVFLFDSQTTGRWRVEDGAAVFYSFKDGSMCTSYRTTPAFLCNAYAPIRIEGDAFTLADVAANTGPRYRIRFLPNQLELIKEEWYYDAWVPVRRSILAPMPETLNYETR